MYLDANQITINDVSMGQYIEKAKYGYHKLWGNDSGRSLSGKNSGTLLGIFPKITLNYGRLTQSALEILAPIFDSANQSLTYYDPNKQQNITISTYSGDWEIEFEEPEVGEPFSISFISNEKRQ